MAASGSPATPDACAEWAAPYAVDLRAVLGSWVRGSRDPTIRLVGTGTAWRTSRTPDGPVALRLASADGVVRAEAWGPGADWQVAALPDLLGAGDDPAGFPADLLPAQLAPAWRRLAPRWRVPRGRRVVETLVVAVLEQKVTGVQSLGAWRSLLAAHGEPAPGPAPEGMRVPPAPDVIRSVPSWRWHRWGVGPRQSDTLMRAMEVAGRLEQCADLPLAQARARLGAVRGIGTWTVAEVAQRALGDADAVSFGDYHLAQQVGYVFTGERDGTDEQMAALLEPFAGHRYRVQRLVEVCGISRPARGPRMTIADHRRI
jgi:3-methyladenine DNA glycosylase/8-oxoguanine DNA glycosylase